MNLNAIKTAITSKAGRQLLLTQKHSPTILFVGGTIGVVATVVLACRGTLKLEDVLYENDKKMGMAKHLREENNPNYSDKDYKQDVGVVYVRTVTKIAKIYAPAFVVGVISISALTGSHIILTNRNIGLTAAYAAVEKGFAEYRKRVLDDVGEEKEREYRYGSETREFVEETTKGHKVTQVARVGPEGASIYAKFFDQLCPDWSPQPEYNRLFIQCQQTYANHKLRAQGHLFLNEVYDSLGIDRTKAGAVVGWVMNDVGDNYVDFGVFDGSERTRDFVNGREGSILLDFNVDGTIFDKI